MRPTNNNTDNDKLSFINKGVIAHRGNSSDFPQNTMEAFKSALRLGVEWIELDVHITADHKLVIIHDRSTKEYADVNLLISSCTYAQLQNVDIAFRFRRINKMNIKQCPPARIPLLSEVIDLIQTQRRTRITIQPKDWSISQIMEMVRLMDEFHLLQVSIIETDPINCIHQPNHFHNL